MDYRQMDQGINRYKRETLYQEVWEQPVTKVAQKYGVSDVMIHKACRALNVPVPTRGYWAKVRAGKMVSKEPLPEHAEKTVILGRSDEYRLEKQKAALPITAYSLRVLPSEERKRVIEAALKLQVDPSQRRLHPVLQNHKAIFNAWAKQYPREPYANWNRDKYRSKAEGEPPLWECVTMDTLPRVHRFLNTLFFAVEELGGKVNEDLSMCIRNERVEIKILEGRDKVPHVLTQKEQQKLEYYEQEKKTSVYLREPQFRKHDYVANGKLRIGAYGEKYIRDTDAVSVETRIGEILLALYMQSENVRIEREKREEKQRKADEDRRQKELQRKRYNVEVERLQALNDEAHDYEIARRIREYIAAVELKSELDEKTAEWIAWAKAKANWYDPTVSIDDPVFGAREHGKKMEKMLPTRSSFGFW